MNKRQHDTQVRLRWAVARGSPAEQRAAAIDFCWAHNIDPYWRWRLQPKITDRPPDLDMPLDVDDYSIMQWRQVLNKATTDSHF